MATPKVKMPLQPSDFAAMLDLPTDVEVISMYVTNDPLSVTLILSSQDGFTELYLPDGGFDPGLSYKTVSRDFFTSS
jgi:hypothetical protein